MKAVVASCWPLVATVGELTGPDPVDLLRINEAYRLTAAVQDSVWPGGWGAIPYPLLLVTPEREFLIGFPRTPPGFAEGRSFAPPWDSDPRATSSAAAESAGNLPGFRATVGHRGWTAGRHGEELNKLDTYRAPRAFSPVPDS